MLVRCGLQRSPSYSLQFVLVQVLVLQPPMYASAVTNVSSFFPAGPNPKPCPFSMPTNSSAETLRCGYPPWHPFQILGKPSTDAYGDSRESWCPSSRLGDSGFAAGGDSYIRFAWDPSLSFQKDGYTEFIEVGFPSAVYVHSIEIGEPRGMGSIVRIKAFNPSEGDYFTVWESLTGEGDLSTHNRFQLRNEYRVFAPFPICQTTFKTDSIRIEMDTRTITDWNELDYVQLTGSLALPGGILPTGSNEVMYVPKPDAFGEDVFSYALSDCPFQPARQALPARVTVSIRPVNDAPRAKNHTLADLAGLFETSGETTTAAVNLTTFVTDVDGDELAYSVGYVRGGVVARVESDLLRIEWPQSMQPGFEIQYSATDRSGAQGTAYILYYPRCRGGIPLSVTELPSHFPECACIAVGRSELRLSTPRTLRIATSALQATCSTRAYLRVHRAPRDSMQNLSPTNAYPASQECPSGVMTEL